MKRLILICVFLFLLFTGFIDAPVQSLKPGSLSLRLRLVFDGKPLNLNNALYTDEHGDTLSIDACRFYLSNIVLTNQTQLIYREPYSYHLVDAEDSVSQVIQLDRVPGGSFSELRFLIGVDSLANVSGAMDGALDPIKGMYWAWNTGYINAKLTGRSPSCNTLHHAFEFHIGGYLPPCQTLRTVVLKIPVIKPNQEQIVSLNVDVGTWFTQVDLHKTNSVLLPCTEAMRLADNYQRMFSVITE